jgi:hypothetical protein
VAAKKRRTGMLHPRTVASNEMGLNQGNFQQAKRPPIHVHATVSVYYRPAFAAVSGEATSDSSPLVGGTVVRVVEYDP